MALKNTALTVCYVAWNTSTNAGQTGDSANHTLKLVQDGTEAAATNSPAQVDSTNAPGVYSLVLTSGDMNFNCVVLCGKSSTANVAIIPIVIVTEQGVLARAAPGASGGMITFGTGTGQLNPTSGGVDLQTIKTQALTCSAGVTIEPFVGTATAALVVDGSGRVILQPTQTGVTIPTVTTVTNQLGAAAIATGVWQDAVAGDFTAASSIGKALFTSAIPGAAGGLFIAGTNAATSVTTAFTSTFTGNLTGSVGSVTGAVGSVTGAVASVTGSVGSVAGNVGGNVVGTVASVVGAVGSVAGNVGGNVVGTVASVVGAVGSVTGSVGSVTGSVTVGTNSDKTGYSLASTGLDSITATAPTGVATTFPQMVVQTWRRFFRKSVKAVAGDTIKTYADDGTTVVTTQTFADDGAGNETLGAAS